MFLSKLDNDLTTMQYFVCLQPTCRQSKRTRMQLHTTKCQCAAMQFREQPIPDMLVRGPRGALHTHAEDTGDTGEPCQAALGLCEAWWHWECLSCWENKDPESKDPESKGDPVTEKPPKKRRWRAAAKKKGKTATAETQRRREGVLSLRRRGRSRT